MKSQTLNINDTQYHVSKVLGSGLTAEVYSATFQQSDFKITPVAIKKVENGSQDSFNKEVDCLDQLDHPNIIRMIDLSFPSDSDRRWTIILELCKEDLFEFVLRNQGLDDTTCRKFFLQLLDGVEYMHQQRYCHRDLKLENLLLTKDHQLKISDFGFGAEMDATEIFRDRVGTKGYAAPEIIKGLPYSGTAVDIFAMGVALFAMRMCNLPFSSASKSNSYYQLLQKQNYTAFWRSFSNYGAHLTDSYKDLVQRMLLDDPEERITIEEIQVHPWVVSKNQDNKTTIGQTKHFNIQGIPSV